MARHREHSSGLWVLPSLAIPLVIAAVAWTAHVASEGNEVAPNVKFAGADLSGATPEVAAAQVGSRETAFLDTPVTIDLGDTSTTMTAGEIGFDYLYEETLDALVRARHGDGPISEFVHWVTTPFETVTIEDYYTLDEAEALEQLSDERFVLETPTEPRLEPDGEIVSVVPGIDGVGIDEEALVEDLAAAAVAEGDVEVVAELIPIPPEVGDEQAQMVADRVNEQTAQGIVAAVGLTTGRLDPEQIRAHVTGEVEDGEMTVSLDVDGLHEDLESLFPDISGPMEKPQLEVVDGQVRVIEEGAPPQVCCSRESTEEVARRLLDEGAPIYQLETRPSEDPEEVAWATGSAIREIVGEFTTNHACCEGRVTNIQTMADKLAGYYMLPGETLSFNDYVGRRTREKGYVPAGAIRGGYMTDEVGGGVSQFTTTMFNAAFFAGLDLDEYQSHTVYFSRYPYGREATLSMPGPDLVLTNSTEYPVLIWPTYDDTSITVSLYSTDHIDVTELDQRISSRGQCRHSQIDRQRTYPDGQVRVDTIVANYRPAEGIDCNGNQIPRP